MFYNCGSGAVVGQLAMQSLTFRKKFMDLFVIWGYAMIYIAAYAFKTEYDRQNGAKIHAVTDMNFLINSAGLTVGAGLYGTGLLKIANFGRALPSFTAFGLLASVQIALLPYVVCYISKEV